MTKVLIADDYVDIQASLLDRIELDQRSRRVPLLHIKGVEARTTPSYPPPRLDTWDDNLGTHTRRLRESDISALRGETRLVSLDLCDEDVDRVILDVEDESPEVIAERIRTAVAQAQRRASGNPPATTDTLALRTGLEALPPPPGVPSVRTLRRAGMGLMASGAALAVVSSVLVLPSIAPLGWLLLGASMTSALLGALAMTVQLDEG